MIVFDSERSEVVGVDCGCAGDLRVRCKRRRRTRLRRAHSHRDGSGFSQCGVVLCRSSNGDQRTAHPVLRVALQAGSDDPRPRNGACLGDVDRVRRQTTPRAHLAWEDAARRGRVADRRPDRSSLRIRRACRTYALRHDKGVSASTANRPIGHCRKPIAGVIVERVAGEGLRCVECGATADAEARTAGAHGWRA